MCIQKSDNNVLPVPFFLIEQNIKYQRLLFDDVYFSASLNAGIFSKYYMNSYFPLTNIFHLQYEEKTGMIPIISSNLSIYRKYFTLGLLVENISSLFYEGHYFIQNYPIVPANMRLVIKWQFLD